MDQAIILISSHGMGQGDPSLQLTLMAKYFELLLTNESLPKAICFYTEGVRLTTENSPVLDALKQLEDRGVRLIICSTCLNYYNLQDKVKAGIVGSMADILEAQTRAAKVITL